MPPPDHLLKYLALLLNGECIVTHNNRISRRSAIKCAVLATAAAAPAAASSREEEFNEKADVVVIGCGAAGAAAAIEAARGGASVIILEKQKKEYHCSNTRLSSGIYLCPDKSIDAGVLRQYILSTYAESGAGADPVLAALAQIWAETAPDTFNWLRTLDPEFNHTSASLFTMPRFMPLWNNFRPHIEAYISTYSNWTDFSTSSFNLPKKLKKNGEALYACLMNGVENEHNIKVLYGARADKLIESKRRVIGVQAELEGSSIRIAAEKAVVIASGGFAFSYELREALLPASINPTWAASSSPFNTGDGIKLALESGAALAGSSTYFDRFCLLLPDSVDGVRLGVVLSCMGRPHSMLVDNFGRRFTAESDLRDEDHHYGFYQKLLELDSTSLCFLNNPSWLIFDRRLLEAGSLSTLAEGSTVSGFVEWKDNQSAVDKGWILKANDVEELARMIASHPDNKSCMTPSELKKTLVRYNQFAMRRLDEDFDANPETIAPIESPPYYAMPISIDVPHMSSGLKTNEDRQVVRWDGSAIDGLYAAGESAPVSRFIHDRGGHLSECLVFGRFVGRTVARLESWR